MIIAKGKEIILSAELGVVDISVVVAFVSTVGLVGTGVVSSVIRVGVGVGEGRRVERTGGVVRMVAGVVIIVGTVEG